LSWFPNCPRIRPASKGKKKSVKIGRIPELVLDNCNETVL
jgi:hypothetical protein